MEGVGSLTSVREFLGSRSQAHLQSFGLVLSGLKGSRQCFRLILLDVKPSHRLAKFQVGTEATGEEPEGSDEEASVANRRIGCLSDEAPADSDSETVEVGQGGTEIFRRGPNPRGFVVRFLLLHQMMPIY